MGRDVQSGLVGTDGPDTVGENPARELVAELERCHRAASLELVDASATQCTSHPNSSRNTHASRSWWRLVKTTCRGSSRDSETIRPPGGSIGSSGTPSGAR